jgi:putative hydrolase of the HAD superfamily
MSRELPRATAGDAQQSLFLPTPRAVLIDAGFTLVSYDGARIAQIAAQAGVTLDPRAVEATEAAMRAELAEHDWPQQPDSGAPPAGGARFFRRVLELSAPAPLAEPILEATAELIWNQHLQANLWSRPLPGVVAALEALNQAGLRLAVVSNSEGTLTALLEQMDFTRHFQAIVDSWVVGVTKPDPRIFQAALQRLDVPAAEAVMVGDSIKADIVGAQGAGIQAALIDPCDLYREVTVPRFRTFPDFVEEVLRLREGGAGSSGTRSTE